jgi:hypothetical protein
MGRAAHERIARDFRIEETVQQTIALYRQLATDSRLRIPLAR